MKLQVVDSNISGRGIATVEPIPSNKLLWEAYRITRKDITEINCTCFVNHSPNPNIKLVRGFMQQPYFMAIRDIEPGEELTADYQVLQQKLKEHYGLNADLMCFLRDPDEYQRMYDVTRVFRADANIDVGKFIDIDV